MKIFLKGLLSLIVVLSLSITAWAQDYSISNKKAIKFYEEAAKHYDLLDSESAIISLENALEKEPRFIEGHLLMSQIYSDMKQIDKAIISLEKAIQINPSFFPTANYFIGEMHLSKGNYDAARKGFQTFLDMNVRDELYNKRAVLGIDNCDFAAYAMENPVDFSPVNLGPGVNTEQPEYFPCLTADDETLLFTRLIKNKSAFNGMHEDFFVSNKVEDEWQASYNVAEVNTLMNEGAPTLSPDGQILIFTACEFEGDYGENKNGMGSCDIFYSEKVGQMWSPPVNLGSNVNSYYWESQPSFSADGKTLFFVRGKYTRNGIGKQDIYTSILGVDGQWSEATKIKGEVNTEFEEESVMIHPDGKTLYFSSNGHPGLGGMDIYMSELNEKGEWGKPINLGYPINTFGNENSILVSANGQLAYFSSDREGGYGDMDIYSFELPEEVRADYVTYLKGLVIDANSYKKLGAQFELIDLETDEVIVSNRSNAKSGEFLVCIPTDRDYALNVSKNGYLFYSDNFSLKGYRDSKPFFTEILLEKIRENATVVLKNVFFDTNEFTLNARSNIELNKLVGLLNANPDLRIEISGHTDDVGNDSDNQLLSEKRAKSVVEYLISQGINTSRLTYKGYGEEKPVSTNDTEEGRAQNRRTEFKIL